MRKIFTAVFGLLFFICSSICSAYAPEGKLFVTMLDIGQGDAFLIETPTQNILIDTGDVDQRNKLVDKLKGAGFEHFERIILTHPHSDHIGGVSAVLKNFTVDEISDNGIVSKSPLYTDYHSADVKFSTLKTGDIIDLGGGVKFKVLYPSQAIVRDVNAGNQKSYPNNESIVGKLIFGDFSMLFTGDAEKFVEETLYQTFNTELKSTVLKAGHHGSKTSSTADFVSVVAPDYVFISAGYKNKFGHPHKESLKTYREFFVLPEKIFCTAFNGSVRIESDGKNNIVLVEHESDWVVDYTNQIVTVTRLD